ncbi:hypothetical protein ACHAWF_012860 [Thalassiosira exigua]
MMFSAAARRMTRSSTFGYSSWQYAALSSTTLDLHAHATRRHFSATRSTKKKNKRGKQKDVLKQRIKNDGKRPGKTPDGHASQVSTSIDDLRSTRVEITPPPSAPGEFEEEIDNLKRSAQPQQPAVPEEVVRELKDEIDAEISEQSKLIFILDAMMASEPGQRRLAGPFYGREAPSIHRERSGEPWPEGVPAELVDRALLLAHLNARVHPWLLAMTARAKPGEGAWEPEEAMRRWHGEGRRLLAKERRERGDLAIGDVVEIPEGCVPSYSEEERHNFANNPGHDAMALELGSTHVAFGFNDLGALLHADLVQSDRRESYGKPLRFVGYEQSTFNVAKYLVVAEMMRDPVMDASSIVQVWYSSTWTEDALRSFRRACRKASVERRAELSTGTEAEGEVAAWIEGWSHASPVAASAARAQWSVRACRNQGDAELGMACQLRREVDRSGLLTYLVMGEFLPEDDGSDERNAVFGNVTMISCEHRRGQIDSLVGETVTNTLLLETILEEMKGRTDEADVMECIKSICLRRVKRLKQLVMKGMIEIDLRCGEVKPLSRDGGRTFAEEVSSLRSSLRANSTSWSNLCDYIELEEFHQVARAYSAEEECVHYGYSMNWLTTVFGADLVDYDSVSDREAVLEQTYDPRAERLFEALDAAKLLIFGFHKNPSMQTSYVLAQTLKEEWLKYFRDAAKSSGINLLGSGMTLENPMTRSPRTLYLTWKY